MSHAQNNGWVIFLLELCIGEREFCHDWMINLKQDEKRKGRTKHKAKLGNVYVQV